jgi:hypothetical protein
MFLIVFLAAPAAAALSAVESRVGLESAAAGAQAPTQAVQALLTPSEQCKLLKAPMQSPTGT